MTPKPVLIRDIGPSHQLYAYTLHIYTLIVLLEHDEQHLFQQQLDAHRSCLASSSAPNVKMTKESFWPVASLSAAVLATANLSTPPAGCSDQYSPQKAP